MACSSSIGLNLDEQRNVFALKISHFDIVPLRFRRVIYGKVTVRLKTIFFVRYKLGTKRVDYSDVNLTATMYDELIFYV